MVRTVHYLKRNHESEIPSNILVVDTEALIERTDSDSQIQRFRLGYAIHLMRKNNQWLQTGYELHSVEDFWNLLDSFSYEKSKLYVVAHNMAYDYTILKIDTYLSNRNFEITMRVIDSVFLLRASNLVFISSTNFYKESLQDLGIIFGLTKGEHPDFENCTDIDLMKYCSRDTSVLANIMIKHLEFLKNNDLGSFRPTLASQALGTFRHRFMHENLLVHDYPEILELEKKSYRGGRCEVFKMGRFENIYYLDINSMYPFVMKSFEYPTKPLCSRPLEKQTVSDMQEAIKQGKFLIAECKLNLNEPMIACKRDKLFFPIGKVIQTITSPEIEYLFNNPSSGEIVEPLSVVIYDKANIFSEYVDYFYSLRKNTDNPAYSKMAKLFLNSLYGKFGQHCSSIPELVTDDISHNMYADIMRETGTNCIRSCDGEKLVKLGDKIYSIIKTDGEFSRDSIPSIASSVTAYSRILLADMMAQAGREHILYCDTDSLFVDSVGFLNLTNRISPTELGFLKLEKMGTVTINGAKNYVFNDEVKLKGIKKNATKINDNTYLQYQFVTKNKRYLNGTPDGEVFVEPVRKIISNKYDKGTVVDGIVHPLVFSEF
jgi:hypothetical protein